MSNPSTFPLRDIFQEFGLLDFIVFLDAHLDLWSRKGNEFKNEFKSSAEQQLNEFKNKTKREFKNRVTQETTKEHVDRLEKKLKETREKLNTSLKRLGQKFNEDKYVRRMEKASFILGVFNLVTALLLLGNPIYIPHFYSIQIVIGLIYRAYTYTVKDYELFLFDLCYAVNILLLLFLYVFPSSKVLFISCYGLSMGSLGTAIPLWRNSMVFHSLDKMISLAIHIYPPFVLTTILFFITEEQKLKYPALASIDSISNLQAIGWNMAFYLLWQLLYWKFVIVSRKAEIAAGKTNSFTYLINDKKSAIGKFAATIPAHYRETVFMLCQALYTLTTLLLPILVLRRSQLFSSIYLLALLAVSISNGSSFYIEVYSKGFEKELIKLKLQLVELQTVPGGETEMSRSNSTEGEEVEKVVESELVEKKEQ